MSQANKLELQLPALAGEGREIDHFVFRDVKASCQSGLVWWLLGSYATTKG
ncbi:MAG: hypothetical protein WCI63_01065 [bacterium]